MTQITISKDEYIKSLDIQMRTLRNAIGDILAIDPEPPGWARSAIDDAEQELQRILEKKRKLEMGSAGDQVVIDIDDYYVDATLKIEGIE